MAEKEYVTRKIERVPVGIAPRRKFTTSQEDFDGAVCDSHAKCVMANCLKRLGKKNPSVGFAGDGTLSFDELNPKTNEWERHVYKGVPKALVKMTYAFDAGTAVAPQQTFHLEHGFVYRIVLWARQRYSGGARRGKNAKPIDARKGLARGRTLRRETLQAALDAVKGKKS